MSKIAQSKFYIGMIAIVLAMILPQLMYFFGEIFAIILLIAGLISVVISEVKWWLKLIVVATTFTLLYFYGEIVYYLLYSN
ncbi:MAG: hypothetical protein ACK4K0_06025 [Flavobacteriales bacterium]